ncbi:RagB/SusD family nutrient uptake outer membrane protein [Cytophagaceae bacterium DM2B3-1]|uniref:RagB/SusD family nutrient uptake outer membrane protein n=1 Tax=Xanthocytophaga flava TaxID=3048013 RepID=A0ABT7CJQ0_9BACT|nr:RagB/SusD family nutrient uptake outer membrane protein [Xanthocytophaga flavus]MDJ1467854.1 RagB/SusD family nutrient uptake outer membrane protein [Xanthocytophaga flavus]MDJ1493932.1 RagB/SusD family nutrient uptake outer membrane protein [Xanthocytophaga flavus]
MKKIIICLLGISLSTISCKDYLVEKPLSRLSYEYYETEAGLEDLVDATYSELRFLFNGEVSFTMTNYGVDEYREASDGQFKHWDNYGAQLNPSSAGHIHDMWTSYYRGINMCNLGIKWIKDFQGGTGILKDDAGKAQRIAELTFLRGFYYFMLVQQFGEIPLVLDGSVEVRLEFTKSPVADIYKSIIADMRAAEAVLPVSQTQIGRITKGAAQHFLSKVYLTRGSAVSDQRGQQGTDMDSVIYYAEEVINSGTYQLQPNYADLWKIENEANREVIFAAQFNNNALLLNGSGNRTHLYFQMVYDTKPGMLRDIANGRPFRRLMPTDYAMDIFDRKNDSRFYKSFRTTYFSNNANSIPKWTAANAPSPDLVGKAKFSVGDTAIFLTMNNNVSDADIAKKPYLWIPRNKFTRQEFLTLIKHLDPTRLDVTTETAGRDGVYARLGETYLIAAEAYGRKENYSKAVEYINVLRSRAAYKAGEAKPAHFWIAEGGTKGDVSSTESEVLITEDVFSTNTPFEKYPVSATTTKQRFIHFILNERTRELLGEFHRWMDLVRTETFYERVKLFNPDATGLQEFHKLRPIPQEHIDRLQKDGTPLNAEQRRAEQNTGY